MLRAGGLGASISRSIKPRQRPPIPEGTPTSVKELIVTNWADKPENRMAFDKISENLRRIQDTVSVPEKEFLEKGHGHPVYEYDEPLEEKAPKKTPTAERGRRRSRAGRSKEPAENPKRSSLLSSFFGNKKSDKKGKGSVLSPR